MWFNWQRKKLLLLLIVLLLLVDISSAHDNNVVGDSHLLSLSHNIQLAADVPTAVPTAEPTAAPTAAPTFAPSASPSRIPTVVPTSRRPTASPSAPRSPTRMPTRSPTTRSPTIRPTTAAPSPATFAPTDPYQGTVQLNLYSELSLKGLAVALVDKATISAIENTIAITLRVNPSQCEYLDSTFTTVTTLSTQIDTTATLMQLNARVKTKIIIDYSQRDVVFLSMRNILLQAYSSGVLNTNMVISRDKFRATALNSAVVNDMQVDSTYSIQDPETTSTKKELSNGAIVGIAIGSTIGFVVLLTILYTFCCFQKKSAKIGADYKAKDAEFDFQTDGF